jgi:hypothetical protein
MVKIVSDFWALEEAARYAKIITYRKDELGKGFTRYRIQAGGLGFDSTVTDDDPMKTRIEDFLRNNRAIRIMGTVSDDFFFG